MAERIGIQIALEGAEKVLSELRGIDKFANSMEKKRYKLKVDAAANKLNKSMDAIRRDQQNFNKAWKNTDRYIAEYQRKMRNVQSAMNRMERNGGMTRALKSQLDGEVAKYQKVIDQLQEFKTKGNRSRMNDTFRTLLRDAQLAKNEIQHEFQGIEVKPDLNLGKIYNKWSGFASRIGSSAITAGNTLQRITSPFDSIVRGAMYGIGYGALNKVTEGLSSSTSRYDTIKTYPKIMESLGFTAKKTAKTVKDGTFTAEESIQALNDSVIGLPTGLDEIVDMAKRYVLATHDMKTGTDVAIAANNAFLASASTEQQRYQGMMQLNDVLAGKKLQTREWMSLAASMPAAIQEIGRLLGYEKNSEFLQALYGNKIDNGKFIKALREVGTEGGKIAKMAEISKQTFEGLSSNIKNAFSRGGYKLLEALDDVLISATGHGTVKNLKDITDGIDSIFESGAKWMRAHPEAIMDFFNYFKTFDWKGLVTGFASASKTVLGVIKNLFDFISGGDTKAVGKFIVYGNLIGKALTILGGTLKGLAPLVGGTGVLGKLATSGAIGSLIGKVISPLAKLKGARAAVAGAEAVAEVGSATSKIPLSWQGVVSKAESIAAIPAMAGSLWLAAKALQEFDKVKGIDSLKPKVIGAMQSIGAFLAEAEVIGFLMQAPVIGQILGIGAAAGGITLAGIATAMIQVGKGLNTISTAQIPDSGRITTVIDAMKTVLRQLSSVDLSLPRSQRGTGKNSKMFADVFESMQSIIKGLGEISKLDIDGGQIDKAKETIGKVREAMEWLKIDIAKLFGDKTYTSEIRGSYSTKNTFNGDALENALGVSGNVNGVIDNITKMIGKLKAFSDKAKELEGLGDMKTLTNMIGTTVSDMGTIAARIKQQSEQLDGIGDAPARFEALLKSVQSIKKIMGIVQTLNETYGMGGELTIFNSLSRMVSGIKGAISGAGDMVGDAMMLSVAAGMIKTAIGNIKSAVEGIDDNIAKTITVKITAKLVGDKEALSKVNNLSAQVDQARVTLTRAVTNLSGTYNAHVTINVTGTLNKNIPTIPSSPFPPHTGGLIDGRGRVLYRAGGGAIPIFKPKGSDRVPAMLTPGEYVQNRRAVSHFGVDFMRHINHLDLEGALRSISGRAGRLAGNTVNITNNTNNAKVVQHIHTHDTNYTFKRANRFVEAL